jgi:hypothetical protein
MNGYKAVEMWRHNVDYDAKAKTLCYFLISKKVRLDY